MSIASKRFVLAQRTTAHVANASELTEAKPNGSNEKVSFQFIFEKWRQQVPQYVGALQTEFQFFIFAKEVQRTEVQSEGLAICRERDAQAETRQTEIRQWPKGEEP
jgi:hypothetical protein